MLHADNSCNILSITTADLQHPQLVKFCCELDLLLLEWYKLGQNHCTPIQISYSYHLDWLKLLLKLPSSLPVPWTRAVQINRPPAQPAPPDRIRPEITRSDSSGGRTRVPTSKTRRRRVGCRIPSSKTRETRPARRPLKSGHFFQIPTSFSQIPTSFSQIPTIFSQIPTTFPDSGGNFFQIPATFSLKSVDFWHHKHRIWPNQWFLITIWQKSRRIQLDLTGSWMARRVSKDSSDNRVHPKPTTTRRQSEPTNPLLLWVGCGLKNDHPILYGSVAGWAKTRPARPMDSPTMDH